MLEERGNFRRKARGKTLFLPKSNKAVKIFNASIIVACENAVNML